MNELEKRSKQNLINTVLIYLASIISNIILSILSIFFIDIHLHTIDMPGIIISIIDFILVIISVVGILCINKLFRYSLIGVYKNNLNKNLRRLQQWVNVLSKNNNTNNGKNFIENFIKYYCDIFDKVLDNPLIYKKYKRDCDRALITLYKLANCCEATGGINEIISHIEEAKLIVKKIDTPTIRKIMESTINSLRIGVHDVDGIYTLVDCGFECLVEQCKDVYAITKMQQLWAANEMLR